MLYETLGHLELLEGKLLRRKFEIRLVRMDSRGLKYLRSAPHTKKYEDIYLFSSHLFVKDRQHSFFLPASASNHKNCSTAFQECAVHVESLHIATVNRGNVSIFTKDLNTI